MERVSFSMKTPEKIFLYIVFLLFFADFILKFVEIELSPINVNDIFAVSGIAITSISFLITCYFLVSAVSIYSKTQEIDKLKFQIDTGMIKFNKYNSILSKLVIKKKQQLMEYSKEIASLMDIFISDQIRLVDGQSLTNFGEQHKIFFETRKKKLYRERCLTALKYLQNDEEQRLNRIREFKNYVNESDFTLLKRIVNNKKESQEVRNLCEFILNEKASGEQGSRKK